MEKILYVMCGPAGCGKTTLIENSCTPNSRHVSRDKIRFALIEERGGDYFDHEKEVFARFAEEIDKAEERIVYADATHLTKRSRAKLLNAINTTKFDRIVAVGFSKTLDILLHQNEKREGLAKVPTSAIKRMHEQYEPPTCAEGFDEVRTIYGG